MEMISLEGRSGTVLGVLCGEHGFAWVWIFAQRFENQHIVTKHVEKTKKQHKCVKFQGCR